MALVRRAEAGRSGQRDLEGRPQRLEDRRRRHLADRILRSGHEPLHRRHRQPVSRSTTRSSVPATTSTPTRSSRSTSPPASSPGISSTRRTIRGTTTRSASTCCTTRRSTARGARSSATSARNGFFYTLDRTNGKFIKAEKYVNDLNWTKGIDPKTGKPVEYNPKLDVQIYNPEARALRGDGKKRACPTWHGGVAHQPLAFNPVKNIAYGVGTEGCFSQNGAAVASLSQGRRHRHEGEPAAQVQQRSVLRRGHGVRRRQPQGDREGGHRHRDPLGRHRRRPAASCSRRCRTAGSSPTTTRRSRSSGASTSARRSRARRSPTRSDRSSIWPCRPSGRHLHPVNCDKLQNSSYLFVFALN